MWSVNVALVANHILLLVGTAWHRNSSGCTQRAVRSNSILLEVWPLNFLLVNAFLWLFTKGYMHYIVSQAAGFKENQIYTLISLKTKVFSYFIQYI